MARILLVSPDGQQVVELRDFNSLGRHPSNTIQLLDKIVSKEHCIIERRGQTLVLRDLGSLNGTYINGERVNGERDLKHGDDIALGGTRARYDDGSGRPMPTPQVHPQQYTQPVQQMQQPAWQAAGAPSMGQAPTPYGGAPSLPMPATAPFVPVGAAAPGGPMPGYPQSPGPGGIVPLATGTRVDVNDKARAIGTQIAAIQKGFLPVEQLTSNPQQLAADYERLRLSHELSREIALERELPKLLTKILLTIFKFVRADRGVIFLMDPHGELVPSASQRRDGTDSPIQVSSTIMSHVIKERATHYLDLVGLSGFEQHYPYQLSGGMQQRVGLVRALAMNPSVLLMDEPFAALDAQTREILQEELLQLMERPEERKTMVFITHSIDEAILLGDRIAVMSARPGRIKEVLDVPFGHPRDGNALRTDPRFGEMRAHIWGELHTARPQLTRSPREVA